jgi:hypothetical protein
VPDLNTIMGLEKTEGSLRGTGNVSCHGRLNADHTLTIWKVKVQIGGLRV